MTSSNTLLSTRVPPAMSVASSERHGLVSGHGDIAASAKAVHQLPATRRLCGGFADDQGIAAAFHFDLRTGADADPHSDD